MPPHSLFTAAALAWGCTAASSTLPPSWAIYAGQNAVSLCPSTCTSRPPFRCLGLFPGPNATPCFQACIADGRCALATWAADDGRCFTRTDNLWHLVSGNTVSACNNDTVPGCALPPPSNTTVVVATLSGTSAGVTSHALSPAVTLDGWNASSPGVGPKWGPSSYLALDLSSPRLIALAAAVGPALLRLGGSPEDSIVYDTDGTCVAGSGGAGPAPGYFCSQVKPYIYGCLTPARWEALLEFGARTNLSIVLGLNGCYGRLSNATAMDFSNARALLRATAASPYRRVLVGLELSNEIVGTTVTPEAWGSDVDTLRGLVATELGTPLVLAGPDGASPDHARRALAATAPGTLAAVTYHHYPSAFIGEGAKTHNHAARNLLNAARNPLICPATILPPPHPPFRLRALALLCPRPRVPADY